MHEKVAQFLASETAKDYAERMAYREKVLFEAGLYDKIYAPAGCEDYEQFPHWDSDTNLRYRIAYLPVNDAEFEQIEKFMKRRSRKLTGLFGEAGSKIKTFAEVNFWVEAVAAVIGGIVAACAFNDGESFFVFLAIACGGVFMAYIVSLFLYGFGQLVEDNQVMREKIEKAKK